MKILDEIIFLEDVPRYDNPNYLCASAGDEGILVRMHPSDYYVVRNTSTSCQSDFLVEKDKIKLKDVFNDTRS